MPHLSSLQRLGLESRLEVAAVLLVLELDLDELLDERGGGGNVEGEVG